MTLTSLTASPTCCETSMTCSMSSPHSFVCDAYYVLIDVGLEIHQQMWCCRHIACVVQVDGTGVACRHGITLSLVARGWGLECGL